MFKHIFVHGVNEWAQFSTNLNWYTFTLINIEFESDKMTYGYEFLFIVLGLGFRIRYNTDKSFALFEEWEKEIEEESGEYDKK